MPTLFQRLRSLRHAIDFRLSERLRRRRGIHREVPARQLPPLDEAAAESVARLRGLYGEEFADRHCARTALGCYEYLDILHRGFDAAGLRAPRGGVMSDVGSANFWYARVLEVFFAPTELLGVEVEGYRRYTDGHSRLDYACGYLEGLPHARFLIADYTELDLPADLISAWFPFINGEALLAWRLPLSLLRPQALFRRVRHNLRPGGLFVMINHGESEACDARELCSAAGLRLRHQGVVRSPLANHRTREPILSIWD